MKKIFATLLSVFVLGSIFCGIANAQTSATSTPSSGESYIVATVNIYNAQIISSDNRDYKIFFTLSNDVGVQPQVRYSIQLTKTMPDSSDLLVDEKVYNSSFSIDSSSTIQQLIDYSIPSSISKGNYKLWIMSKNNNGLTLASAYVGEIKFNPTTTGNITIVPESCYTMVGLTKNNPSDSINVKSTDLFTLSCNVISSYETNILVSPVFETRIHSLYGNIVPQIGGDTGSIIVKKGSNLIKVSLPRASSSQLYTNVFSLESADKQIATNKIISNYFLEGDNGSVMNVIFDKTFYSKGDTAKVKIFAVVSMGTSTKTNSKLSILVTDKDGKNCSDLIKNSLDNKPVIELSIPITADCVNPTANVVLSATKSTGEDITLDTQKYGVTTPKENIPVNYVNILVISIMFIILIMFVFIYKKKNTSVIKVIALIIISGGFMFGIAGKTEALTETVGYENPCAGTDCYMVFTYNLNKSYYSPGESIVVTGTIDKGSYPGKADWGVQGREYHTLSIMDTRIDSSTDKRALVENSVSGDFDKCNPNYRYFQTSNSGTQTFTAPTTIGIHYMNATYRNHYSQLYYGWFCAVTETRTVDNDAAYRSIPFTVEPTPTLTKNYDPPTYNSPASLNISNTGSLFTCTLTDVTHGKVLSNALIGNITTDPLTAATTFSLVCTSGGGIVSTAVVTATPPPGPVITSSIINPLLLWNTTSYVRWSTPNSTSCSLTESIDGGTANIVLTRAVDGNGPDYPVTYTWNKDPKSHTLNFVITCINSYGATSSPLQITVPSYIPPPVLAPVNTRVSPDVQTTYDPNTPQVGTCKIRGYTCDQNDFGTPLNVSLTPKDIDLNTTWKPQDIGIEEWSSITYALGKNLFVAVSKTGSVATSSDGVNWHQSSPVAGGSWNSVIYANSLFIIAGSNGLIMTSPDGSNWTKHTTAELNNWTSIAYDSGEFVAVSSDGTHRAVYSITNGIDWVTSVGNLPANAWTSVVSAGGRYVAVSNGSVATSIDGITWSIISKPGAWSSIAYSIVSQTLVAVATDGSVMNSTDYGATWTARTTGVEPNSWTSVIYFGTKNAFYAVSSTGIHRVMISQDSGNSWNSMTASQANPWRTIVGGQSTGMTAILVALSSDGNNRAMTYTVESYNNNLANLPSGTLDSKNCGLSLSPSGGSNHDFEFIIPQYSILVDGKKHDVTITSYGIQPKIMNNAPSGSNNVWETSLTCYPGNLVNPIGDLNTAGDVPASSLNCKVNGWTCDPKKPSQQLTVDLTSSNWTTATAPNHQWQSIAYGNSTYVAVGLDQAVAYSKDNGTSWTSVTLPASLNTTQWFSVTYGGSIFLATGKGTTANSIMTSSDGINWTPQSAAPDSTHYCIDPSNGASCYGTYNMLSAYGNGKYITVSQKDGAVQTSSDGGVTWTGYYIPLTNGTLSPRSLIFGGGKFVMAGVFNTQTGTFYSNDVILTSTDGINWTNSQIPENKTGLPATYNPFPPYMMTPSYTNGTSISTYANLPYGIGNRPNYNVPATSPVTSVICTGLTLAYGNGIFIANQSNCQNPGNTLMTSPDGINWTTQAIRTNINVIYPARLMGYANGQFISDSSSLGSGSYYVISSDGINWSKQPTPLNSSSYINSLAYNNGTIISTNSNYGIMVNTPQIISTTIANTTNSNTSSSCGTGDHGYSFTIPQSNPIADGKIHSIAVIAHGVDTNGVSDGLTSSFSTTTLTCAPNVPVVPAIISFTATPTSVNPGATTTLKWITAAADSCSLTGNGDTFNATTSAGFITSAINGKVTYTLSCSNSAGPKIATLDVTLPPPVISFIATPASISTGHKSVLSWTTNSGSCKLTGNGFNYTSTKLSDSTSTPLLVNSGTEMNYLNYVLDCTNSYGTAEKTLTVAVGPRVVSPNVETDKKSQQPCVVTPESLMCQVPAGYNSCTVTNADTSVVIDSSVVDGVLIADTTGLPANSQLDTACGDGSPSQPIIVTSTFEPLTFSAPSLTCTPAQSGSGGNIYVNKTTTWLVKVNNSLTYKIDDNPVSVGWSGTTIGTKTTLGTTLNNIYTGVGLKKIQAVTNVINLTTGGSIPAYCSATTTVKASPGATIEI